ncbi:MAG TPA: DUF4124 domain-containing protein [Woeseiaceae bacterium]|jgi:hypothetical protein|nr:DUF4124 domain-containing protein [Woeseiaceae bacterium]
MRLIPSAIAVCLLLPLHASAGEVYSYTDENGVKVITDRPPPEASDLPKYIVNEHGVTVGEIEGKKTDEELEAERVARQIDMQRELQRRADQALLATYVNVEEIIMHRDRRVELYQAQARVTELYLRNSQRRLQSLEREARRFKPYSSDPNAPMIDESLMEDIGDTKDTIDRQQRNLDKYKSSQEDVIKQFAGDIARFKRLKGID